MIRILRAAAWFLAVLFIVPGVLMFVADVLFETGMLRPIHGDSPAGGLIAGPVSIFIGVVIAAFLWNTRPQESQMISN